MSNGTTHKKYSLYLSKRLTEDNRTLKMETRQEAAVLFVFFATIRRWIKKLEKKEIKKWEFCTSPIWYYSKRLVLWLSRCLLKSNLCV